jgi:hypothetical protein
LTCSLILSVAPGAQGCPLFHRVSRWSCDLLRYGLHHFSQLYGLHLSPKNQCSSSPATILSDTGGTCVCPPDSMSDLCETNEEYLLCVQVVKRDLVTATAAISALTSFCMGLFANMPIALAPGMGLNAYFAYTVVGFHGSGTSSYTAYVRFCVTFCGTCHLLAA